jgi:hypothetical protein
MQAFKRCIVDVLQCISCQLQGCEFTSLAIVSHKVTALERSK